jgi:hypothetical protein
MTSDLRISLVKKYQHLVQTCAGASLVLLLPYADKPGLSNNPLLGFGTY